MAHRNMKRIIENADIDRRYSLTVVELFKLRSEDPLVAIIDAFEYGYELGKRAEKSKRKNLRF